MKKVLLEHRDRYPHMEIQDAVKLLYQSEFGGGHMIKDQEKSLKRLNKEYGGLKGNRAETGRQENRADGSGHKRWESIGGGLVRMDVACLDDGLRPETLNQMFVRSAALTKGSITGLEQKFLLLLDCCEKKELTFEAEAVKAYIQQYRADGYPSVSHSGCYRKYYHPAYRVVSEEYAGYYQVFLEIDRAITSGNGRQVNIAIDGRCGSGKSTLGRILQEVYSCGLFHMDDYFLRPGQRTEERLNEIGGNVDYERFQSEILKHLGDDGGLEYQRYDCGRQCLSESISVPYAGLNVIEGAYSQHPYFGNVYDKRFFLDITEEEQISRIRIRNGELMLKRFQNEWIPMENRYFQKYRIKENSQCISVPL